MGDMPPARPVPVPTRPVTARWLTSRVTSWYGSHARDLPWRAGDASPWGVLVSEFMLAQTPVSRVLPVWPAWLRRWPTPAALAAVEPGAAIRAWGRLGYPRRAIRLHATARAIETDHDGVVPATEAQLRALPGVGAYTAAAVAAFAYHRRAIVLDTNVRRVLGRLLAAQPLPRPAVDRAEQVRAEELLPRAGAAAARWSVALMELGALVCTARSPACTSCPLQDRCAWWLAGSPEPAERGPRQAYVGTDRQARGRLLGILRDVDSPVDEEEFVAAWPATAQRDRALTGLVADGLAVHDGPGHYRLP